MEVLLYPLETRRKSQPWETQSNQLARKGFAC